MVLFLLRNSVNNIRFKISRTCTEKRIMQDLVLLLLIFIIENTWSQIHIELNKHKISATNCGTLFR